MVSKVQADVIETQGGDPIIDATDPNNPVTIFDPRLDSMDANSRIMSKAQFMAAAAERKVKYAGSGQIKQTDGFAKLVANGNTGLGYLLHNKEYATSKEYDSTLAFTLDTRAYPDRSQRLTYNINGYRIIIDEFSQTERVGTPGIPFKGIAVPVIETDYSNVVNNVAVGDFIIGNDLTFEHCAFGDFATDTGSVVSNIAGTTVTHNAGAGLYDIVLSNTTDVPIVRVNDIAPMLAGVEYVIDVDITTSNATIEAYATLRNASGTVTTILQLLPVGGNTYRLVVTPEAYVDNIYIRPINASGAVGDAWTMDNLSIKQNAPAVIACQTAITAGDDIRTKAADLYGVDDASCQDLMIIETWVEDISVRGMVYPLGNVQAQAYEPAGMPTQTLGAFADADTYSLFGSWQTPGSFKGEGYVWADLTKEQKYIFASDPDNNIFIDGDTVYQVRYRVRTVRGYGNNWSGLEMVDTTTAGNVESTNKSLRLWGAGTDINDFGPDNGDLAYYSKEPGLFGTDAVNMVPFIIAQRANHGVYHPVYNPYGCGKAYETGAAKLWYNATNINNLVDCFDPTKIATIDTVTPANISNYANKLADPVTYANYEIVGSIDSGIINEINSMYAEWISANQVIDKRMLATKITNYKDILETSFKQLINGTYRRSSDIMDYGVIVKDIIVNGAAINNTGTTTNYGNVGWRIDVPINYSDTINTFSTYYPDASDVYGSPYGHTMLVGDNGNIMAIAGLFTLHRNGEFRFSVNASDATTKVAEFNTLFPVGTVIDIYGPKVSNIKCRDITIVCDIIGDLSNYPANWVGQRLPGKPNLVVNDTTLVTLANGRSGTAGGYNIQLSRPVYNTLSSGAVKVIMFNGGVVTEIPEHINYNDLFSTGNTMGHYINPNSNRLLINLTGTGAHDANIEANAVLLVHYKHTPLYLPASTNDSCLAIGDGYVSASTQKDRGDLLRNALIGKPGLSNATDPITDDYNYPVPARTKDPVTGELMSGVPLLHPELPIGDARMNMVKILPYLKKRDGMAFLSFIFKEMKYKEMDDVMPTTSTLAANDHYGQAVAIYGNRMVVGAPEDDTDGADAGAVYVFEWDGSGSWVEVQKITGAVGAAAGNGFGAAVWMDATELLVGAPYSTSATGKVDRFTWNGSAYVYDTNFVSAGVVAGDRYGAAIAKSGDRLLVGAPRTTVGGQSQAGRVYALDWGGAAYADTTTLDPADPAANDHFGNSVAIDGDRIAVGIPHNDGYAGNNAGRVNTYYWSVDAYYEVVRVTDSDATSGDWFGASVAMANNLLFIGAPYEDFTDADRGKLYVYKWTGITYEEISTIVSPYSLTTEHFGRAVATDGSTLAIGSDNVDTIADNAGGAYTLQLKDILDGKGVKGYWGDDSAFDVIDGVASKADDNGMPIKYGQCELALPYIIPNIIE